MVKCLQSLIKPTDLLLLADFETTGYYHDPETFPVEVAGKFLDHNLKVLDSFDLLINWKGFAHARLGWESPMELEAFGVHGIEIKTLRNANKDDIVTSIINMKIEHLQKDYERVILASDNAPFEMHYARMLDLKVHYNSIDVKPYIQVARVERPNSKTKHHRAMSDVEGLLKAMLKAKFVYDSLDEAIAFCKC